MGDQIFTSTNINKNSVMSYDNIRYLNRDFLGIIANGNKTLYKLTGNYLNAQTILPILKNNTNNEFTHIPLTDTSIYSTVQQIKIFIKPSFNRDKVLNDISKILSIKGANITFGDIYISLTEIVELKDISYFKYNKQTHIIQGKEKTISTFIKCSISNKIVWIPIYALDKNHSNKQSTFNSGDLLELVYNYIVYHLFLHDKNNPVLNMQKGSSNISINQNYPAFAKDFKDSFITYIRNIQDGNFSSSNKKYKIRIDDGGFQDQVRLVIDSKISADKLQVLIEKFFENSIDLMKNEAINTINTRKNILSLAKLTYYDGFPNKIDVISLGRFDTETAKMDMMITTTLKNNQIATIPISLKNSNNSLLAQRGIANLVSSGLNDGEDLYAPIKLFLYFYFGIPASDLKDWIKILKDNNNDIYEMINNKIMKDHLNNNTEQFCEGLKRAFFGTGSVFDESGNLPQDLMYLKNAYKKEIDRYNNLKKMLKEDLNLGHLVDEFDKIIKKTSYDKLGKDHAISHHTIEKIKKYMVNNKNLIKVYPLDGTKPPSSRDYIHIALSNENDESVAETLVFIRLKHTENEKRMYFNIGNSQLFK